MRKKVIIGIVIAAIIALIVWAYSSTSMISWWGLSSLSFSGLAAEYWPDTGGLKRRNHRNTPTPEGCPSCLW